MLELNLFIMKKKQVLDVITWNSVTFSSPCFTPAAPVFTRTQRDGNRIVKMK